MKALIFLLLTTLWVSAIHPVAIASAPVAKPEKAKAAPVEELSPDVKAFIKLCLEDEEKQYRGAEKWLMEQKTIMPKTRDQMMEILSGLVWKIDKQRAHTLALQIKNPKLQKSVLAQYEVLESLPPTPVKEK